MDGPPDSKVNGVSWKLQVRRTRLPPGSVVLGSPSAASAVVKNADGRVRMHFLPPPPPPPENPWDAQESPKFETFLPEGLYLQELSTVIISSKEPFSVDRLREEMLLAVDDKIGIFLLSTLES